MPVCPHCRSNQTVKDGFRKLSSGKIIPKYYCKKCRRYWSQPSALHSTTVNRHHTILRKYVAEESIRTLSKSYATGKKQIGRIIHHYLTRIKDSCYIALNLKPKWSGILLFSNKKIPIKGRSRSKHHVWLCGLDCVTGDLPHYQLETKANAASLRSYFRELKKCGYSLHILVCPHNRLITSSAQQIFGHDIQIQFCTAHFLHEIRHKTKRFPSSHRVHHLVDAIERLITAPDADSALIHLRNFQSLATHSGIEKEIVSLFDRYSSNLATHITHFHRNGVIPHTLEEIEKIFKKLEKRIRALKVFSNYNHASAWLRAWALLYRLTPVSFMADNRLLPPLNRAGALIIKAADLRLIRM